jgi:inosine/xanthosine triphosphate pyrophosphatase family protein
MEIHKDRGAKFVCAACLVDKNDKNDKKLYESIGETNGQILRNLQAPIIHGLPMSSCFLPDRLDKVYASLEDKSQISHRGKAFRKVAEYLKNNF